MHLPNFEFQIPISLILINDWLKMILEIIFARNLAKSAYKYAYFFQKAFLCSRRSQCRNYCIYILLCPWINERKHILERCQKWGKKYQLVIIIMLIIQASSKLACNTQTRQKCTVWSVNDGLSRNLRKPPRPVYIT